MDNNTIARMPIQIGGGQRIRDLQPGWHQVRGGLVNFAFMGNGNVLRVIGITLDNLAQTVEGWTYHLGNQPFNTNLAKVLYELRAAGHGKISYTCLDYHLTGAGKSALIGDYFKQFKAAQGLDVQNDFGETSITNKILNALAEQN